MKRVTVLAETAVPIGNIDTFESSVDHRVLASVLRAFGTVFSGK